MKLIKIHMCIIDQWSNVYFSLDAQPEIQILKKDKKGRKVDFETTSFMDEPFGTDVFFEKGSGYKVIILSIYFTFPFYS